MRVGLRGSLFTSLIVALLLVPGSLASTNASTCDGGTCVLALVKLAEADQGVFWPTLAVTYTNNFNANVTGVVWCVIRDSTGQTVSVTSASLELTPGSSGTAYPFGYGISQVSPYNVTVFATDPDGVAISTAASIFVTPYA